MQFDRNRSTLTATQQQVDELAQHVASSGTIKPEWSEAGLTSRTTNELEPTVAGIVQILGNPTRSVVIEQFDGALVELLFIAWDSNGRATITSGGPDDVLVSTATEIGLLPSLLAQRLRMGSSEAADGGPLETTAGMFEAALAQTAEAATNDRLGQVLSALRHGWRASGSWPHQDTDRSVTVFSAGEFGLWKVDRPLSTMSPDTPVTLEPIDQKTAIALLGDVITGRR